MSGSHNGTWALRATITLALDACDGHWCTLNWLIGRVVAPKHVVQRLCDEMVATGDAQAEMIDGQPCYGVHVGAASKVVA